MERNEIATDALLEIFGLDIMELEEDMDLLDNGLLDSLSMVNLIMYLEVRLGRRIDRKDYCMEDLRSVSKIKKFLLYLK
ncbi:phosphopantetheine-binding protein [Proteiniclasticum ruminis]|uniref:D-alanine--poly(Phosphoribitol) ligase subunit 2 n=1 Tax=Proteiniclasticum ruminis TaxID=398199 RepID=A0A1G8Q4V6_9CLOT|nr:phosphopantetheine-binding protein [Proteiniclasticum ruminis]SDI99784.1 D-alanine--poly(phosphoribitol) ligase subunit 2 [Proteiniclasticum ruminis]